MDEEQLKKEAEYFAMTMDDVLGRGIESEGSTKKAWESLDERHGVKANDEEQTHVNLQLVTSPHNSVAIPYHSMYAIQLVIGKLLEYRDVRQRLDEICLYSPQTQVRIRGHFLDRIYDRLLKQSVRCLQVAPVRTELEPVEGGRITEIFVHRSGPEDVVEYRDEPSTKQSN